MEDRSVLFELNHAEERIDSTNASGDHGWQKVTYAKKQKKNQAKTSDSSRVVTNSTAIPGADNVFRSLEKQSEERRRRIESQREAIAAELVAPVRSDRQRRSDDDYDESDEELVPVNGITEYGNGRVKKPKEKKPKKPKVTIAEAAAKIDASDLEAFLADVSVSYESQQDIQLMRFADYYGRAFAAVSSSQFPWLKLFRESTLAKIADIPISHISEDVYKTSADWISKHSFESLGSFVLWLLDSIFADLTQQTGGKVSKKGTQQTTSKSQVAIFLVLAIVLRRKPDVLIQVLPHLKENAKFQGQDKLPVFIWMITQACQGDLAVGLYLWAHQILPILGGRSGSNPQTRDLVLQLVERVLSSPKARTILVNGAVRKGERLLPPSALELILTVTFPVASARVKATERFEAIYPILREVALAGAPGSKAMKQVSLQILSFAVKAAGEGIPELSKEAVSIFIWCLSQNPECYKQWDKIYTENVEASVAILKKLSDEWKVLSGKQSSLETLGQTLNSFRNKNDNAISGGEDTTRQALFKEADKYCRALLARLSRGHGCMKSMVLAIVVLAVGALAIFPNMDESWDWNKLSSLINPHQS